MIVMIKRIATVSLVLATFVSCANASDEIPIEGQYLKNRPCKGDRSDPAALKVTISSNEIVHSGGTCSIDSRRNEGARSIFVVTCKFRSGATMGSEIEFTRRDTNSLHVLQQDASFEADLYKCPR
jgi:hypothetical protein